MHLNLLDKCLLYDKGSYRCPPPPVPHSKWTRSDWVRYIDEHGHWVTKDLVDRYTTTVEGAAEFEAVTKGHVPPMPRRWVRPILEEDMKDRD